MTRRLADDAAPVPDGEGTRPLAGTSSAKNRRDPDTSALYLLFMAVDDRPSLNQKSLQMRRF
jgi:hypothetical protein